LVETSSHIKAIRIKATSSEDKKQKIFFPNLDALRFICFFMVFLFHCYKTIFENLKDSGHYNSFFSSIEFLFQNGELGVNFFFVLSGFLITYLLIKEREFSGNIHLGNFYLRRILRIWPMFYLCVFIGFVIMPVLKTIAGQQPGEIANPLYYIFLINNFDYIQSWPSFPDALILIVLWSVAVEEQFYLTWPLLLKFIPKKVYPILFCLIIAGTLIFRSFYTGNSDHDYAVRHFHTLSVIGDMALGGLMAFYCSYNNRFLQFVTNLKKWQIIMIYAGSIVILLFRNQLFESPILLIFERIVIAFFFGFIILEQNFAKQSLFKFSKLKTISKLGLYTYGLYCLHFFVISIVQSGFPKLGFSINNPFTAIIASILALILVLGLCVLTYKYFEKPFLKMKDRFAFIRK
jgi:peptidoglycan/LPS O-acetylase OafA/YrhL